VRDSSNADSVERRPADDSAAGAPARGSRALTAILPNGKVVWLRSEPPLAPAADLRHLADLAEHSARWREARSRSHRRAIEHLARTTADDAERLNEAHVERSEKQRRRLAVEFNALDRRVSQAIEKHRGAVERQVQIDRESLRRLRRRDLWDQIVLLSSLPLFAAYGQRGTPFGANNLALMLTLLVWLVGDEIINALFASSRKDIPPYALRDADVWSYLAPIGNVLAGWWLMDGRQHERFVAGRGELKAKRFEVITAVPAGKLGFRYRSTVELGQMIGPVHFEDFRGFTGVPAVATLSTFKFKDVGLKASAKISGVTAEVERGRLIIHVTVIAEAIPDFAVDPVPSPLESAEFAWMVDTDKPATIT